MTAQFRSNIRIRWVRFLAPSLMLILGAGCGNSAPTTPPDQEAIRKEAEKQRMMQRKERKPQQPVPEP